MQLTPFLCCIKYNLLCCIKLVNTLCSVIDRTKHCVLSFPMILGAAAVYVVIRIIMCVYVILYKPQ